MERDEQGTGPRTLVLLGDSILANAAYARPAPDSATLLRRLLPDWSVLRLAQDGATMGDVVAQVRSMPVRADAVVLSAGGNDAIQHLGLLSRSAASSADVLADLLDIADDFERRYESIAGLAAEMAARTILCTIYEVPLEPPRFASLARVPLALLNDRIARIALRLGLDVLELRAVCTERHDFVQQIEPSARGAEKISRAIAGLLNPSTGLHAARIFG